MARNGFISLDRKIIEWRWFKNPNTVLVFIYLLFSANWKDSEIEHITIPRGTALTSVKRISEDTGLTTREVRTALNHLKTTNEVTIETTTKFSLITVNNYDKYQSPDRQFDKQSTNNRQTDDKQTTTSNKNNKNNKKNNSSSRLPTKYEVIDYFRRHGGKEEEGRDFFEKYEEIGWVLDDGSPIKAWRTFADREIKKNKEYEPIKTDMYGNRIMVEDDSI